MFGQHFNLIAEGGLSNIQPSGRRTEGTGFHNGYKVVVIFNIHNSYIIDLFAQICKSYNKKLYVYQKKVFYFIGA